MNVRGRLLMAAFLIAGGGLALVYFLSSNKDGSAAAAAASSGGTSSVSGNQSKIIVVAEPAASASFIRTESTGLTRSGLPPNAPLSWKRHIASVELEATALNLLASDRPGDWLQALALNSLCTSGFDLGDLSPSLVEETDAIYGSAFRRVAQLSSVRCGELGKLSFLDRLSGVYARAEQAKEPLALAPLVTNATIDQGLSDDQLKRLSEVLLDNESATLWLALNFRRLDRILQNAEGFNGISRDDLRAASVVAFCLSGLDCGESSVLSLQLCANTGGQICSEGGVLSALQKMEPDLARRINTSAQRIDSALTEGNPIALGFRRRN
jgi:hypothetical protein